MNNRFSCCPVGWVGSGVRGKAENRLHSQVNKAPDKALSASLAETIIILAGGIAIRTVNKTADVSREN